MLFKSIKVNQNMKTIYKLLSTVLALALAGCASTPSKTLPLTDQVIESNKGNFEGLWNSWLKPQLNGQGNIDIADQRQKVATENSISSEFSRFCKLMDGVPLSSEQKYGAKTLCTDNKGNYLGEIVTTRYDGFLNVSMDSREMRQKRNEAAAAAAAAESQRQYRSLASPDQLNMQQLISLTSKYKDNDPDSLVPKAKEILAVMLAARDKQRAIDAENAAKQRAVDEANRRTKLEIKQIGDQICSFSEGTVDQPTGYIVMGQTQYRKIYGRNRIVGFVEKIAGKKIQIRISGINFSGEGLNESLDSLTNFKGGSRLNINSLIWDSIYDWEAC